jgi:hypothetical protein
LAKDLDQEGDFNNAALEGELALTLPEFGTSDAQIHFLLAKLYWKLKQPDWQRPIWRNSKQLPRQHTGDLCLAKISKGHSTWVGYGSKTKLRLQSGMECLPPNRHGLTRHLRPYQ